MLWCPDTNLKAFLNQINSSSSTFFYDPKAFNNVIPNLVFYAMYRIMAMLKQSIHSFNGIKGVFLTHTKLFEIRIWKFNAHASWM